MPAYPFQKPPKGYRKFTRPNGTIIEWFGEVELVPGVIGPRTVIATFPEVLKTQQESTDA